MANGNYTGILYCRKVLHFVSNQAKKNSYTHISFAGFVTDPIREMNWIKVDEEIFFFLAECTLTF
jgi:hypothetical protein